MQGQLEKREKRERVYVKVTSDFDATGYMLPRTIIWSDGRIFKIDEVKDFRPASTLGNGRTGDCYTVVICGVEKHLFFEKTSELFAARVDIPTVKAPRLKRDPLREQLQRGAHGLLAARLVCVRHGDRQRRLAPHAFVEDVLKRNHFEQIVGEDNICNHIDLALARARQLVGA